MTQTKNKSDICRYSNDTMPRWGDVIKAFKLVGQDMFICVGCGRTLKWARNPRNPMIYMVPRHVSTNTTEK